MSNWLILKSKLWWNMPISGKTSLSICNNCCSCLVCCLSWHPDLNSWQCTLALWFVARDIRIFEMLQLLLSHVLHIRWSNKLVSTCFYCSLTVELNWSRINLYKLNDWLLIWTSIWSKSTNFCFFCLELDVKNI